MGASRRARRGAQTRWSAVHARAASAMADGDRAWFEQHPDEPVRHRRARPHEFCRPDRPGCVPAFEVPDLPGTTVDVWVEVRQLAPGVRTRQAYLILHPSDGDGARVRWAAA